MPRLTARSAAVTALLIAAAMLFVSIGFGLRVPNETRLDPFGEAGSLDYRALRFGRFEPLRGEFIEGELGSVIGTGSVRFEAAPRRVTRITPLVGRVEPVVVAHEFINDDTDDAYSIASVPFAARTNTETATKEDGEPTDCGSAGGTAWYSFRAPRNAGLIANTFGSDHATTLGVFAGKRPDNLDPVGCDTDPGGFSQVAFAAERGVTYWFQIAAPNGGGTLVFNLLLQTVTTRASISSAGVQGDAAAVLPVISGNGRYVSFYSGSRTYTPDTPPPDPCVPTRFFDVCRRIVLLRDRAKHSLKRIDLSPGEPLLNPRGPLTQTSISASISGDGRYVAYWSGFSKLVENDTNDTFDVFVLDQRRGVLKRVSVSSSGRQANGRSFHGALSADGRYVAFTSVATNLVDGDTNGVPDVFVHDNVTGRTIRVSIGASGQQGNGARSIEFPVEAGSHLVSMSANGRFVVFRSASSNLVHGDTNDAADYFLRDVGMKTTRRISVSSTGEEANADSRQPVGAAQWTVSNDGRYVYFNSDASNLVPNDNNAAEDLFVRDTLKRTTRRVSVSSSGEEANSGVGTQDPSAVFSNVGFLLVEPENGSQVSYSATPDGEYILFSAAATNLVPGDTNETIDVFIRHVPSGTTRLLSVSSNGVQGNGPSNSPMISADARFAVFSSSATNLVPGDTNGFDDVFVSELSGGENISGWY